VSKEEQQNEWRFTKRQDGAIIIEGDLNHENAEAFRQALGLLKAEPDSKTVLDMSGFDVDDGIGVAIAINALRDLLERAGWVQLIGAPQILGHNLYRVGLMGANTTIELIDMREDEPYG
jgi:anti-anti-sigma regulatory factor